MAIGENAYTDLNTIRYRVAQIEGWLSKAYEGRIPKSDIVDPIRNIIREIENDLIIIETE